MHTSKHASKCEESIGFARLSIPLFETKSGQISHYCPPVLACKQKLAPDIVQQAGPLSRTHHLNAAMGSSNASWAGAMASVPSTTQPPVR